ncbi:MAG: TonB-dependent receptor [Wenzhouxiangella sp.]|jgi:vitamin B12 transporter|nr:TonB-dependent receptor [Wenzhouxiangella sp.]
MSVVRIPGLIMAAVVCLSPLSAVADQRIDGTIVVTANRVDQPLDKALARTSVITREEIELSQAPDLLELLRQQAGVDIARTGGAGGQTSVFLRGSNANHVLVLIDGVRASAAGTGAFAWELLDVGLIERIEIVRGPRAARWGSDAIGGVIQIFTRRPDRLSLRAGYGSHEDLSLAAGIGGKQAGLLVAGRRVGGFSAQNERGFAFDPDDDGFEVMSAAGGGAHRLGNGVLDWTVRLVDGEVEFDQGVSDITNYAASLNYELDVSGNWHWSGNAALYRDRLDTSTAFGRSENITRRMQAGLLGERKFGPGNHWLLGVDAWNESGVARGSWSDSRHNIGVWTGLDGSWEKLDYEASLRADRDATFGSAVTGNLAGGWRPRENWRLFASVGRAFRAPNFNQLFSPGFFGAFAGNPDLDPETSISGELGADWHLSPSSSLTLSLFQTRIDDLIDFAGENFQAINIRRAQIQGAELVYRLDLERWRVQAQITRQEAEDRDSGLDLLRRPDEKAAVSLDHRFAGGHWLGVELIYTGQRFDIGQMELPSYTLINLRGGWQFSESWGLEGRIENAADRFYEPASGFNAADRSIFVALNFGR